MLPATPVFPEEPVLPAGPVLPAATGVCIFPLPPSAQPLPSLPSSRAQRLQLQPGPV